MKLRNLWHKIALSIGMAHAEPLVVKQRAKTKANASNRRWPKPPTKAKFKQNQRKQRATAARKKAR
ncbi:hypothetical protein [Thalassotalea euphylliae]|uniref:Uncharacterized protein n=1 Tax=Thalassotalea euphylliae TaxID=1655234 RepID=A0A3E0U2X1_9GAMM|nr:hypothetical protein [Thalassotalea euphylliae]REL31070.1 hypothetical protein DXX94_10285 [Thalassotalea euphylliae]